MTYFGEVRQIDVGTKETVVIGAVYTLSDIAWLAGGAALAGLGIGWLVRARFGSRRIQNHYAGLLSEEKHRRGELRLELEDHKAESTRLKTTLGTNTADLKRRNADLERVSLRLGRSDDAITKLSRDLATAMGETAKLRGQKTDREATISTLRATTNRAPVAAVNLQRELEAANAAVSRQRIDAAGYRATIAAISRELQETQEGFDASSSLERYRSRIAAVISEKERTDLELHELREIHSQCRTSSAKPDITVVVGGSRPSNGGAPSPLQNGSAPTVDPTKNTG